MSVSAIMLPWVANRPISLVRCPQGRARKCFFQKHDAGSFGEHVRHVEIREKNGEKQPYLYISDADGIATCVQMGTIEFHGWGSLASRSEEHTSELQSLMRISYTDFRLRKYTTVLHKH